jgi:hypothetical protein
LYAHTGIVYSNKYKIHRAKNNESRGQ